MRAEPVNGATRLYAGGIAGVHMTSASDTSSEGFGGIIGIDYRVAPTVRLVGEVGYIAISSTSAQPTTLTLPGGASISATSTSGWVPIHVGAKYYLLQPGLLRVFVLGEVGAMFVHTSAQTTTTVPRSAPVSVDGSDSSTYVGGNLSLGIEAGYVDARIGALTADFGHVQESTLVACALTVRFASF